jgi:glycine/D-amino acid oxidase-like deaminating enzyme
VSCDVVVVGTELCGLVAAALLARAGKRVVVIDDGDPGYASPLHDRFAPTAPALSRIPTGGPALGVVEALGLKQDIRRLLGEPSPLGLVDDPDIRTQLAADPEERKRELLRVFGAEGGKRAAEIVAAATADERHALLQEAAFLHQDGLFVRFKARKRQSALGASADVDADALVAPLLDVPLSVAMAQLVPFAQGRPDADVKGLGGLLALLQVQAGVHANAKGGLGGRAAWRDELVRQICGHGGELLKERVEQAVCDGKTITAVKATGANDYLARAVIDATSRRDLTARIDACRRRDKILESEQKTDTAGDAVVVRWLLPSVLLPRGMPVGTLVLRSPPQQAVLVSVYGGAPLKEGHRGPGLDESLAVVVAGTMGPPGTAEAEAKRLDDLLDHLLPFARARVVAKDVVPGAAARAAFGRFRLADEPEHLLGGRRPRTAITNLVRAGRDLVPVFGVEGELVAARSVSALVDEIFGAGKGDAA